MSTEFNVTSCPWDPGSWREAGIRLRCPNDTLGRSLYQCAPNKGKSSLVEFCLKGSIGRYEKGLCVHSMFNGFLGVEKCDHFIYGCPNMSYINNEIYKYPACLEINTDAHCYLADPFCSNISRVQEDATRTTADIQNTVNTMAVLGATLLVLGILTGLILFFWCKWKHQYEPVPTDEETFGLSETERIEREKIVKDIGEHGIEFILNFELKEAHHHFIAGLLQIPVEILRLPKESLKNFVKMLFEGETPVYSGQCMVVGCGGAGKTTLVNNMRGKPEEVPLSTIGIDCHLNVFEIKEKTLIVTTDEEKSRPSTQICVKTLIPKENANQSERPNSDNSMNDSDFKINDSRQSNANVSEIKSIETDDKAVESTQPNELQEQELNADGENEKGDVDDDGDDDDIDDNEKINDRKEVNKSKDVIPVAKNEINKVSVMDFAGQNVYYACHHLYFSPRAIFILVVDMSKDLNDIAKDSSLNHQLMYSGWSYIEYVKYWLGSIHTYSSPNAPVILVASHSEDISEWVPEEVLNWGEEARDRYLDCARGGTQTVHHARGMIVGCALAGKTTLLKRLLGCSEKEIQGVESTIGLEVHEEIFEVCDETKSLKARTQIKDDKNGGYSAGSVNSKTLSFFDFGGQCAYYACHQIYLTRRAFYVVVVDASKPLDQKVDKNVCDQDGSIFSGWTYGDYFVFWIKSIHTYCGSEREIDPKPIVLIVATHWEEGIRQFKDKDHLMESLQSQLPDSSNLSRYIRKDHCYCIQLSVPLHDVERRFFDKACHQRWKERIPKEWSLFELEITQKKYQKRIIEMSDIKPQLPEITAECQKRSNGAAEGKHDMLRYFHDAGKVLYFNEVGLKEMIIIDVQWFIDSFKNIISDKLHFKGIPVTMKDWDEYYRTGNLKDGLLMEIWKQKDKELFERLKKENEKYEINMGSFEHDERYLEHHKGSLLNFMQRLGLLAVGEESHYVPCMNRKEMEKELPDLINESERKSSVLIYQFEFLPFFLYFRLIVACMQEKGWTVLENEGTSCLYRNAALFSYMEYCVVLSVTEESIQLQVFHPGPGSELEREKTCSIQERVEEMLNNSARTFHRKIQFVRGFRCRMDQNNPIAMDIKGHFLQGKEILKEDRTVRCPLHLIDDYHFINTTELTRYWKL